MGNSPAKTLLIVIAGLFVGLLVWNLASTQDPEYVKVARTYFTDLNNNQTSQLYSLTCAAQQQRFQPDVYTKQVSGNWAKQTKGLGKLEKIQLAGTDHRGDTAIVSFNFKFDKKTKPNQVAMVKQAEGWRVCGGGFTTGTGLPGETTTTLAPTTTTSK